MNCNLCQRMSRTRLCPSLIVHYRPQTWVRKTRLFGMERGAIDINVPSVPNFGAASFCRTLARLPEYSTITVYQSVRIRYANCLK